MLVQAGGQHAVGEPRGLRIDDMVEEGTELVTFTVPT
jgi:hypothetical protein